MTLVLGPDAVRAAVRMVDVVGAIERALREEASGNVVMPPRMNISTPAGFFRMAPVQMSGSGLMGFKAFHGSPAAGARYLVSVYEQEGGRLLALLDGHYLTAVRTGATAALAARELARNGPCRVAVIGSGLEARTNLEALATVREIAHVTVFSPRAESRQAFRTYAGTRLGLGCTDVTSPELCVKGADVVIVATNTRGSSSRIAFRGAWFAEGAHVSSIGSTSPGGREIDSEAFARADLVVADAPAQAREESGDVIAACEAGVTWDPLELSRLVNDPTSRPVGMRRTLYKSVGTAAQDVMAGFVVYQNALRCGLGCDVGEFLERKAI